MKVKIRFVASPIPKSVDYLRLLESSAHGVMAVPIGPVALNMPPWDELAHLFVNELADVYVNVVCAPRGVLIAPPVCFDQAIPDASDFVPGTIFAAFWTSGVINIAAVVGGEGDSDALGRYDVAMLDMQPLALRAYIDNLIVEKGI
ncbi:MAG: hypothetical protein Q8S00_32565 [Deltaproteobacteria bacterium]|nr:hypothetical protein [Deltaproteobacteria bacterium]